MKNINIITAINNPILYYELSKEKNINVMCKDILYKDGIIDFLNENKRIDIILINEKIPGEINDEKLIKKIKEINKKIIIIYILEKQNKNLEIILKENNINRIIYINELNLNKILELINNKKNNNLVKNNNNENFLFNINNFKDKIITISGPINVGKTNFIINFSNIIKNKKILIIDFDLNNPNIYIFFGIKKYSNKLNKINNNIINLINKSNNYEEIINYFIIKLNKNKYLFSGINLLVNNNLNNQKIFFQKFFNYILNNYDLILFDMGSNNNKNINNLIYENSNYNFVLTEGNLIGINKTKIFLEKNNYKKNIKFIINKKDKYCINKKILNKIFEFDILGEIKYENIYSDFVNKNYKFCFKNKYKKQYKNIYEKCFNKERKNKNG